MQGAPQFLIGQTVQLGTLAGWTENTIIHVQCVSSKKSDDLERNCEDRIRLGLLRVKELPDKDVQQSRWWGLLDFQSLRVALASIGHSMGGVLMVLLGISSVGLILVWGLEKPPLLRGVGREVGTIPSRTESPSTNRPTRRDTKSSVWLPLSPAKTKSSTKARFPLSVIRSSHPARLLNPEVMRQLSLREPQITHLRRLHRRHQARLANPVADGHTAGEEVGLHIRQQALTVLDDRQREKWMKILSEQP